MADAINAPEKEPEPKEPEMKNDSSFDVKEQAQDMMDDVKGMKNAKAEDFKPGMTKGMPTALKVIQWLLIISAVFSVISIFSVYNTPGSRVLALITTVVSLVLVWAINKRAMWAYWLLIALIIYSVVTSLINWTGGVVVTLVIDAIMLYYVTKSKSWFKPADKKV